MTAQPVVRVLVVHQRPEEFQVMAPAPFDYSDPIAIPAGDAYAVLAWASTAKGDKVVAALCNRHPNVSDTRSDLISRLAFPFSRVEHPPLTPADTDSLLRNQEGTATYDAWLETVEQRRLQFEGAVDAALSQVPD